MANTIAKQTMLDGNRTLIVKVTVLGDGSGEETATKLIDVSTYDSHNLSKGNSKAWDEVSVMRIESFLTSFSVDLLWDATTDLRFGEITPNTARQDFRPMGGLINDAGSGVTGDIMFTTVGLGSGDVGMFILTMKKRSS